MNSGTAEKEKAHKLATQLASECKCLACGHPAPSLPAHWPRHRGLGGGHAGWSYLEWVPLCFNCHEILDRRAGVSYAVDLQRSNIILAIAIGLPKWHEKAKRWMKNR